METTVAKQEDEKLLKAVEKTVNLKFENANEQDVRLYKKRWLMLSLYVLYMLCNSAQWLQYSIISNIVEKYYRVTEWHVNLTSLIMMMCYIPLGLPAAYLMEKIGLRWTALLGVLGTTLGSWIKVFSAHPDGFYVTLLGQTVVATAQVMMLSVPQKLSSTWFGEREVSSACSIGVFGFQLGIVVGFFLPPMLVRDHADYGMVGRDLRAMFLSFAVFTTAIALLVYFFFQDRPEHPPTLSQAKALKTHGRSSYLPTLKRLFSSRSYVAMFLLTGVNNGCFNGLSTLLNQIFLEYFPGETEDAGRAGVTMVISGMAASLCFGYALDRTKRFKLLLIGVYYMSSVAMLAFTFLLGTRSMSLAYVGAAFVGTFLCGFTAVSFDVATELTYPESELIVGTIMNIMSLFFTVLATLLFGFVNRSCGFFWGNLSIVATLFVGASAMIPIRFDLKRTPAQKERECETVL